MGPIKHKALINVDLGEGFGNWTITSDEDLLPFIDHANIACGFHASYVFLFSFCATPSIATANRSREMLYKTIPRA
jgi:lactam utilization protein B